MEQSCHFLLLLILSAASEFGALGKVVGNNMVVENLTNKFLQIIPSNANDSIVSMLVIEDNNITLNETDQQALSSYPQLLELHLGGNLVTSVPAKYFSGLSHLRVLSLARNSITSLNPDSFSGLDHLEELDLSNNKLTDLPGNLLTELKSLKILHLHENPWNCSCPLLYTVGRMNDANITIGDQNITCASPAEHRGKHILKTMNLCSTSFPVTMSMEHKSLPPITSQQSIIYMLTATLTSQNCSASKDHKPVHGNTWKFTACVAALALTTCTLILTAIKGPSLYKRFHNYRHRRLDEDDEEEGQQTMSTETGGYESQQTFMFEELSHRIQEQEEEDGYFEDPYIKRAEDAEGEIPGESEVQ